MLVIIAVSLVPLTFKQEPTALIVIDKICVFIFIIDYILRWITADYKFENASVWSFVRYPFSFLAIIDLLSILPSLTIISRSFKMLRLVRMFRAMRVFRVFKAVRYSKNVYIILEVLKKAKRSLSAVCFLAGGYILIAALIIFNLEPDTFENFFEAAKADYEPDSLYGAGIIPEGYQSTLMEQSYNGDYLCFTSVRCANDSVRSSESDYIRICDAIAQDPHLLVLDTYYYTTDTLIQMSEDFSVLQWISMLFVFLVLLISFHFNIKNTVLGFMPILLSWMIVLGAMVLFDMRFNLINIIISTFIFGIGVDYSIFVMNGLTDNNSQKLAYHKTAIFFSAVTLIVTVSSMVFAVHPAIKSVGFSTLVGLLSAVILSYVLQPAVYRWLNRNKEA